LLLARGAVEARAYGWMRPAPVGANPPVLCYRPGSSRSAGVPPAATLPSTHNPATLTDRLPLTDNSTPSTDTSSPFTPLPELYARAAPMLRCSSGQVFRVDLEAPLTLHLAFFEWDDTDAGSVLEAFRHMPEACLGSIGMTLLSKEPPLLYQIGPDTLSFDHTVFRDPAPAAGIAALGAQVHAFRAVWVADLPAANARHGLAGTSIDRLRTIRFHSALNRFRPAHARVIQGAVRGATTTAAAWQAFHDTLLVDLTFESLPKEGRTPIRPAHEPMIKAQE
ncbi:MAG: hypothetical protein WCP45_17170, partial [Verrucomicrobiota bacterium]